MKSPQILTIIIVAAVLALIGFFVAPLLSVNSTAVAVSLFIGAFISPFLSNKGGGESTSASEEVKTLYVGNLPYRANETVVRELFSEYGTVHSVRLMKDKHTGKRRGFGFVEMSAKNSDTAVEQLNDTEFQQRTLKVREAKERPEKSEES